MTFSGILKVLYTFGVPAGIALFLVYFITSSVDNNLKAIQADLAQHKIESQEMRQNNLELRVEMSNMTLILQNICANTARNQADRNACFNRN